MIKVSNNGVYLINGKEIVENYSVNKEQAKKGTIAYSILSSHNTSGNDNKLKIKFDAMASHDITYVGIIQTARAGGLQKFPLPYALTNCHNSLCAVGGTINEDDHIFGLSACKKYGGIYVPANMAVIHQFARERLVKCGAMILGSDSHTRYGALGTMGVGEGGPELVKQLLDNTYDIDYPQVVLVNVKGSPKKGVGPHDVAIALVKAVFKTGFVKNKVLEFVGEGIKNLSVDFRNGIDVMTTETTCLTSIWETDEKVEEYYAMHGKKADYKKLNPQSVAYYDSYIELDLNKMESMIALPFHPSNAFTIKEFLANAKDILTEIDENAKKTFGDKINLDLASKVINGKVYADQGVIAGCAGGLYENLSVSADILDGKSTGDGYFSLSCYPASMPVYKSITEQGIASKLIDAGAVIKPCFCGPCFGAGDVPGNNCFSIRHTTRNFPNREGSKPDQMQIAGVALMDARSISATACNGGAITPATDFEYTENKRVYNFDSEIYAKRVYDGYGKPQPTAELRYGPNIADWPKMYEMKDNMLAEFCAVIYDEVTTTDELIPSGETSSYRSNPYKLSEFALSRRVPEYVGLSKKCREQAEDLRNGKVSDKISDALKVLGKSADEVYFGSVIFANKPGDGSAREQAASCQKVLGGVANVAREYATKRYRSNCINWGMVPFTIDENTDFNYKSGDLLFVENVKENILNGKEEFNAKIISGDKITPIKLYCKNLTDNEKKILLDGCLINFYASERK